MKFPYPNSKKLFLTVEISQLFHKHDCSYSEAKEILKLTTDEIDQQLKDLKCNEKTTIQPMNHFNPYC